MRPCRDYLGNPPPPGSPPQIPFSKGQNKGVGYLLIPLPSVAHPARPHQNKNGLLSLLIPSHLQETEQPQAFVLPLCPLWLRVLLLLATRYWQLMADQGNKVLSRNLPQQLVSTGYRVLGIVVLIAGALLLLGSVGWQSNRPLPYCFYLLPREANEVEAILGAMVVSDVGTNGQPCAGSRQLELQLDQLS